MVSGINNLALGIYQQQMFQPQSHTVKTSEPLNSFDIEDQAIISAEAMLNNSLEKFNSGGDNGVELAVSGILAKTIVSANVNVINTKKEMIDDILKM